MNDTAPGPVDLIKAAGAKFIGSLKAKREAIADLYGVYLDARNNDQVAVAIVAELKASPELPQSNNLAASIAYLAVSTERRRVSEIKQILELAESDGVSVGQMYDWQVRRAQEATEKRNSSGKVKGQLAMHAVATRLYVESPYHHTLQAPPLITDCLPGDFLIQICHRKTKGVWESSWIKATKDSYQFVLEAQTSSEAGQTPVPTTYQDLVAEVAKQAA